MLKEHLKSKISHGRRGKMVNISDVASEAHVSVATVSRVLNDKDTVKKETRERVYAAIEKLNFEPNILARNFRRSESRVILIITPNITNPYYAHILSGIGDEASSLGYSALIFNTGGSLEKEKEGMEMLKKRRADGAILLASAVDSPHLLEYADRYPVVQCAEYDESTDLPRVSIDNYKAAAEVLEYLVSLGHRKIATISSRNSYISTVQRMDAYKAAMADSGIAVPKSYIAYADGDYSFKSGKKAAMKLLSLKDRPTAVFCISDTLALGTVSAALELGIKIPEELTVTGFDDVDDTTMFHPYITTVKQPCYKLGEKAMKLLYDRIQKKEEKNHLILSYQFVIRESSGPLK